MDTLASVVRLDVELGIHAVEVAALRERARTCCERLGFVVLQDDALHLFLPLSVARSLLPK